MSGILLDLALIPVAYSGAFLLRRDFHLSKQTMCAMLESLPWIIGTTYAAFLVSKVYQGMRRHAGFVDALRFAQGVLLAGILLELVSFIRPLELSNSIIILFAILLYNLLLFARLAPSLLAQDETSLASVGGGVLIVGAGELAEAAVRYGFSCPSRSRRLVGFVDDDRFKLGKLVRGFPVLGKVDDLDQLYAVRPFDQLIVATALSTEQLTLLREFADRHKLSARRFSIVLDDASPNENNE